MGRGRGAGKEQKHSFGKVCASGKDLTGIEGDVDQHRTFTT